MIHEAMVLEYAGSDLALVTLGEAMRLSFLVALLVNLFAPWGVATRPGAPALVIGLVALAGKVALAGMAIATFEVFTAKLRLFRVPELLAGGFVLAVFASLTALVVR
jgi:formate hydrogenlyase subunit 4